MNMHLAPVDLQVKPTRETYDRLQQAYDHFNKALFGNELPNALITLQRRKGSFGFFAAERFRNQDGRQADEIALNPAKFEGRPVIDILATLVHEMVHLWQHHCGHPGRGRYHNREWAAKMTAVGLAPTASGAEGGKETGESVGHLIIAGGPFEAAANRLIARNFTIDWKEVQIDPVAGITGEGEAEPESRSGKRVRYACPECDLKAWAKHDAHLLCGDHKVPLVPAE
ncbi:SprT-like domain-containing protein [Mesorhizobium sp. YIM 152430]|uniref:SprT-like domain-containing protein n=1 Tax=Mesorhizobium sp. YIM 152430 TaxID=3031761 RepID=UPI0023D9AB57|nr:SprT-like domain-containing protein [Mesorhizobium sp. YIM 152430]MDF1600941.1 SprT-like domain-containing protein [Mesorhizobium sp. YIM 152430]